MRSWCGLLAVLFLLPAALAQGSPSLVFDDPTGDVVIATADGNTQQPDPTGNYDNVDVTGGGVWSEDDETVTFYLTLSELTEASQVPLPFSDPDYYLYFKYGQQGYRVFVATALDNPTNGVFGRDGTSVGRLERQVDEFRYAGLEEATVEMDYSENTVHITIPRDAIRDHNQAPLAQNSTLHDMFVESKSMGWFGFPIGFGQGQATQVGIPQVLDRGPDEGAGSYVMKTGSVQQVGDLFAVSEDPIRWTNGEATTLTFITSVTNLGKEPLDASVGVQGAAPGWELAHSDTITVPAGASVDVPVLVNIPFSHEHGRTHLFSSVFETVDGSHKAAAMLGVHWPAVPQPAGHHDRLWLHSAPQEIPPPFDALFGGVHGWFSASEEVELDTAQSIPAMFVQPPGVFGGAEGVAYWFLRLEPGLRMGLDFDTEREGLLELGFTFPVPIVDPRVEVTLIHTTDGGDQGNSQGNGTRGGFDRTQELMAGVSETTSGPVSGGYDVDIPVSALPGIDIIPYDPEANLQLLIAVRATAVIGGGFANQALITPTLNPATSVMQWPLEEYHDPTDLSFQTDASVNIKVGDKGQERFINPKDTIVYRFELDYTGTTTARFDAALSGSNLEWGSIVGDASFDLKPGATRTLAVAVHAPDDARDGEQSDLTLRIVQANNTAIQAGIGMLTTVTTSQEIDDESALLKELNGDLTSDKDAPGPALALLLVALVVVARRR